MTQYKALEQAAGSGWLEQWSELEKRLRSLETELRQAHYANTTDSEAKARLDAYYQVLLPSLEPIRQTQKTRFLRSVNDPTLKTIQRDFEAEQRLFCEANRDLIGQHKVSVNRFASLMSQLEVSLADQVLSMGQAMGRLDHPNRDVREEAWRGLWQSRLEAHQRFDQLYLEQLKLRESIAHNAGFANYRDYRWLERRRFDYSPEDCRVFAQGVHQHILPLLSELREWKRERLGLQTLRPWDAGVDPFGTAPLRPFEGQQDLLEKANRLFEEMDAEIAKVFRHFLEHGQLDLESRPQKALTVYADFYFDRQEAVLFMQSSNKPHDLRNFFHEFGHVLHHYLACAQPLYWSQTVPMEFMEVAAQGMELLMLPWLEQFYPVTEHQRVQFGIYEGILAHLAFIPVLDLFQQWVYSQPAGELTVADLDRQYSVLAAEFLVGLDYDGLEGQRAKGWYFNHLFWQPFYYIEYGFAWVGALDLWQSYRQRPQQTLSNYKTGLAMGNQPLSQLYAQVGSVFPSTVADLERVTAFVRAELSLK